MSGPTPHRVMVDGIPAGARWTGLVERAARHVLEAEAAGPAELSVALMDDAGMQRLNREHLECDAPTDVLAFPLWQDAEPVVGDIYIGVDQAVRQATDEGVPLREELVRLAVHGTLHVLKWDHPEDAAAREGSPMYRRQEELVRAVLNGEGSA